MNGEIATGFFREGTEILLVRREGAARDQWDAVSIPTDETETDPQRLVDTVGCSASVRLVRGGDPIDVSDGDTRRTVRPYLFECDTREIALGDQIGGHEWLQPPKILDRTTVGGLWKAYLAVAPSVRTVETDTEHGAGFVSLRALEVLRDSAAAAVDSGAGYDSVAASARELRSARPSMAVIATRIDRVMASAERAPASILDRAISACTEAVEADRAAAERAASFLGDRVFTLSRSGTVHSALETARPASVFVAESRPAREGIDTAERLADAGLATTVLVDAAIEEVITERDIDTVLVGADTVLEDGSVVNKIGTQTAVRAARAARVDSYVVCSRDKIAPGTTFDPEFGSAETVYDGDGDLEVHNPTFERVPPSALSAIITEEGVYAPSAIEPIANEHRSLREWQE
jgi:translation initiation factor 2B subunit (eIF-2B alpha/beta/delta family)